MGIFGKRAQAYETAGLQRPGLGGKILNQIGMNLLGVDFEGQRLAQALAQKQGAFLNDLEGKLGPQYAAGEAPTVGEGGNAASWEYTPPVNTGPGLSIKSPELPALALEAQRLGVPLAGLLDVMKAQKLDLKETNGRIWDPSDAANRERFIPKVGEGQTLGMDGKVLNLPGYVESTAELEGAKTGAQEGAKAKLDLITVNMPDGSTQQIPRDVAVQAILQSLVPGAGAASGGGMGGLGRSQTPAARIEAEGTARTGVDRAAERPKAGAMMAEMDRTTDTVLKRIREAKAKISPLTAGFGANLGGIAGTGAYDLAAALKSIGGVISVDRLQTMRGNSPTGGALGSITERELEMLSSLEGAIQQGQSPDQLLKNLNDLEKNLSAIKAQRGAAFKQTYGESGTAPAAAPTARPAASLKAVPLADRLAEARRRGLIQ